MKYWIFLLLSSLLQVGWLLSLRQTQGFTRALPIAFYVLFGSSSTYLLSRALEVIPMGTAYAVWTGVSVAGSVAVELLLAREIGAARLACILLILAGTTGLKLASAGPAMNSSPPSHLEGPRGAKSMSMAKPMNFT